MGPRKNKSSFKRDSQGRTILGSAKEMAEWVKLGFKEQDSNNSPDIPFKRHYIDLSNCVLYISYPVGSLEPVSRIFNLCDMVGIVPGIERIEGDPNYLFEVTKDIHFDGSELYGNFFHYVKFDGMVRMDNVTVRSNFSCFKCLFLDYVYMQHIHITGRSDFEQCEFRKGLVMNGADADLFHFNNCTVKERLWLSSVKLNNHHISGYHQSIEITNSAVDNLTLSKVNTDGLPVYVGDSTVCGMRADSVSLNSSLCYNSCSLDGVMTVVMDDGGQRNMIKELVFHSCEMDAQYHIENTNLEKVEFNFSKIDDKGRLRLSQCGVKDFTVGCSSVFGQMDVLENRISSICLEGTCVQGYLNFQGNEVGDYSDRQTLRLLKNEAKKINDDVEATKLYAKEMKLLLADKDISLWDKASLRLNKWFSGFGESWGRALLMTSALSIVCTILMLGVGSSKYGFNLSGEFMGVGQYITALLDSINVFSIPLFSDTIKEYGLNVFGQVLYFLIKVIVAYGTYQFVVAFRKYGRN
jgi:hypothetical protein